MPPEEPQTRHSQRLPTLQSALHLLYAGRALAGFVADSQTPREPIELGIVDATIEAFTDEIRATELLHEAAVLVGDVDWTCNSILEIFSGSHRGSVKIRFLLSGSLILQA